MRAVQFDTYGDVDVLEVRDVPRPAPGRGQLLVRVRTAAVNPDDLPRIEGQLDEILPVTFPAGVGCDFAGVVEEVGEGVNHLAIGSEVIGFSHSHDALAEYVVAPRHHVVHRPATVSWEVGGGLALAGMTAYAAVRAVAPRPGETILVSAAAGGVGSLVVQLVQRTGAAVVGIAGRQHHSWLREHGVVPVDHAGTVAEIAAAVTHAAGGPVHALVDCFGHGYVEAAVELLGVPPDRIDTVVDMGAARRFGAGNLGQESAAQAHVLEELVRLASTGELEVPIATVLPLADLRLAYRLLEGHHTHGKIVLSVD
ncbi:NADP-dependent oxidoreductase [Actinotalea sp. M2MS4P-6]|uniref:NADP-dependent oxidoreductase n=1 Tax=Actinotalea sp. M2MS4P-6 TaxID=2983762 RepID=UPI0021E4355E|nr:NADP-dependent oxidoreductase [Actinotalea sp. M2MS4P-6]MCV2396012.1 NADP-dependent oxidoreductase [Actinotalea sp. M2MS4P-6]